MSSFYRIAMSGICALAIVCSAAVVSAQVAPGPPGEDGAPSQNTRPTPRRGNSKLAGMGMSVDGSRSKSGGFVDLLENGDLSKFRGYQKEEIGSGWNVDGKYLHFDGSKSGDIVTVEEYQDFELQFDWKVSPGGNSGVMYRVSLGDGAPYLSGPEYQVLDDTKHKDGEKELTSAGSIYGLYPPSSPKKRKAGVWNKAKIIVDGNKITHYVNGKRVVEATIDSGEWRDRLADSKFKAWEKFAKNRSGHIAFQDHGDEVWYRNIKIKRLSGDAMAAKETKRPKRAGNSKLRGMMQSRDGSNSDNNRRAAEEAALGRDQPPQRPAPGGNSKLRQMQQSRPGTQPKKGDDKGQGTGVSAPGG